MHGIPLTLAAWTDWIWLIVLAAGVIGSAISNMKKQGQKQRKLDEGPAAEDLEAMAARRRAELRQQMAGRGGGGTAGEPGNLTMAERIARARAKAQYEQRSQTMAGPVRAQPQVPNEAQRRALAQRQAELARRQQATSAQQQAKARAQQQAQQRARLQAQQQRAQQQRAQAQAHARAQAQARQRGVLLHEHVEGPVLTESTTKRTVTSKLDAKRPDARPAATRSTAGLLTSRGLSRDELRQAIILNEVLGRPVGLRDFGG
jgi:hypothetical protein